MIFNSENMKPDLIPQAVLWDMDGILIDTHHYHFCAWKEVLSGYGIELDQAMFKEIFGIKNRLIIDKLFKRGNDLSFIREIETKKENLFRKLIQGKAALLPGVQEWLVKFRNLKLLQAVASSAPSENVDFLLYENGIQEFFSAIVNADGLPSKPDPAIFLKAASLLDVEPQRCVVIEDAISGIQAALSANMKCIAVANSLPMEELGMANLILPQLNALTEEAFFNLYRN